MRERGVRFGGVSVEHHRRRGARRGPGPDVGRPKHAVVGEQAARVGQPAVRERELRVLDERLLEEVDRLVQAFFRPLVQVIAALDVEIARGKVAVAVTPRRALLGVGQLRPEFFHDDPGDAFLCGDRVGERCVDRLGPQVVAARAIHQLGGDAYSIARQPDAAADMKRGVNATARR